MSHLAPYIVRALPEHRPQPENQKAFLGLKI